jgi:hypothetical protein
MNPKLDPKKLKIPFGGKATASKPKVDPTCNIVFNFTNLPEELQNVIAAYVYCLEYGLPR